jgi:hypothetical protein
VLGLAPGRYRVSADSGVHDGELAPLEVELPAGGSTTLELRFALD